MLGRFLRRESGHARFVLEEGPFGLSLHVQGAGGEELALRTEAWALLESRERGWQLFDRRADPDETVDVKQAHPEILERLRPMLQELAEEEPGEGSSVEAVMDERTRVELRALGYVP